MVKGGTAGTVLATLPVGIRPLETEVYTAYSSTGVARIEVKSNGYIQHISGGTGWVSLSGIVFKAER
jgi:hypothetical protein